MKTKTTLFFSLLFLVFLSVAFAGKIDPQQAARVARNFYFEQTGSKKTITLENIRPELIFTKDMGSYALYYIFNIAEKQGFVIVSADDRVPPVLGYSLTAPYSLKDMPPAQARFMSNYATQIRWIHENNSEAWPDVSRSWDHFSAEPFTPLKNTRDVNPLIQTQWDQGCFYNAFCPPDNTATGNCLHALAGCGAIAMAQIMKYYNAPIHGVGDHGYNHPEYGNLYANFGATTYDWANMPNTLSAQNDALATLIYHCGVSQDMDYGPELSSSYASAIDYAFINYFNYSSQTLWKWRDNFAPAVWENMLREELDATRPLLYYGNDNGTNGHFFNCDGYQGTDYFHFNWGWSGSNDGYYYLNSLTPGGNNFTTSQGAIFNLAPNNPGPSTYTMDFENTPDFSLTFGDWTSTDVDGHATFGFENYSFLHMGDPMAFICFNPSQVTPAMTDVAIQPHSGQKFGACFASSVLSNNDWFISPKILLGTGGQFSFWVKSYTAQYGLDKYRVGISTTDNNPSSFLFLSGTQPLQAPVTWTKKIFNLSDYNNQSVYLAIQCVSDTSFILMIDDLEIKTNGAPVITADFSADQTSLHVGGTVDFSDQSSGNPSSWTWTFNGADPSSSTQQNPSEIRYNSPGTYDVTLAISNGTLADTLTKTGYITVSGYPSSMSLDFESLADFTLDFTPWTTADIGGGNTYGITGISFPHAGEPMAYICFNPSASTPPEPYMKPYTGNKLGCCFSSMPPYNPNNKWLISPKLSFAAAPKIEFWVQTYNAQLYGYERYNVGVSTTDNNPYHFTNVNPSEETAPAIWTRRSYDLSAYSNQDVYIGIQCVSNDQFIFMIDDIFISSVTGITDPERPVNMIVYPNPARDVLFLKLNGSVDQPITVRFTNSLGEVILTRESRIGSEPLKLDVSDLQQGIYFLYIKTGNNEQFHKVSILHD